jgi:hypothetical protein
VGRQGAKIPQGPLKYNGECQATTALLVGAGLLWIPFVKLTSGQLNQHLQSAKVYIPPTTAAVSPVGALWRVSTLRSPRLGPTKELPTDRCELEDVTLQRPQ